MTQLDTIFAATEQAQKQTQDALAALDQLISSAHNAKDALAKKLVAAKRHALFADASPEAIKAFLEDPTLIIPLGNNDFEIAVPTAAGVQLGWLERLQGAYSVFRVNQFTHLLAPIPEWLREKLDLQPPPFEAYLDGTTLTVKGDVECVIETIGKKAILKRNRDQIVIRPASRFDVLRAIIRQGFLPFTPQPIAQEFLRDPLTALVRDEKEKPLLNLRPKQLRDWEVMRDKCGNVLITAYMQTGKSFLVLWALAALKGTKVIAAPKRSIVEQWRLRVNHYLTPEAAAEVIITTYQGLRKHAQREDVVLLVGDEAHHLPADYAVELFYNFRTQYRLGTTATPIREDGNADLLPALFGYPVGADWDIDPSQKPKVTVWLVRNVAEKFKIVKELADKPCDGKVMVFCNFKETGHKLAKQIGVPFVFGDTKNQLKAIYDAPIVVVSAIANEGLSVPVRRAIEAEFWFGSRMESGQRLGRGAHQIEGLTRAGEHHVLMTPDEYQRYGKRLDIYYQFGLNVTFIATDESLSRSTLPKQSLRAKRATPHRIVTPAPKPTRTTSAVTDEIAHAMALPAVDAKLRKAESLVENSARSSVRRAFRICFSAAFKPEEIVEGLGRTGDRTLARYRAACRALQSVELFAADSEGRYTVNKSVLARLRALAAAVQ